MVTGVDGILTLDTSQQFRFTPPAGFEDSDIMDVTYTYAGRQPLTLSRTNPGPIHTLRGFQSGTTEVVVEIEVERPGQPQQPYRATCNFYVGFGKYM